MGKVVANDASDWKTSNTQMPNRIRRATAESLILEHQRIMTIIPLDPMNDNDPVAMGTITRALIWAELYIKLLCCTAML